MNDDPFLNRDKHEPNKKWNDKDFNPHYLVLGILIGLFFGTMTDYFFIGLGSGFLLGVFLTILRFKTH